MSETKREENAAAPEKLYTKEDTAQFLKEISAGQLDSSGLHLHRLIALNHLLNRPNVSELFDEELKSIARDLWRKLKQGGLELVDPPFLFGAPSSDGKEGKDGKTNGTPATAAVGSIQ